MKTWAMIRDGLLESRRKALFWVILGISLLAVGAMAMFQVRDDGLYVLGQHLVGPAMGASTAHGASPEQIRGLTAMMVWSGFEQLALGMAGATLCLIATAGFVPDFLRAGRVDLTLSRPVTRWQVLLAKYAGGLLFVAIHSGVFVVLSFLVIWINSGRPYPGMLIAWPLMIYQFAFLYAFSVLIGVLTRSTVFAILASLGFWIVCNTLNHLRSFAVLTAEWPAWVRQGLEAGYWVLPKVADIDLIARQVQWWQWQALYGASTPDVQFSAGQIWSVNPALSIGTSLAFAALLLAAAAWRFRTMDC